MQSTYNVTLGAFLQPLLQWNSSITYSECVFVALCIQHATRMRLIVIRGMPISAILFHIVSETAWFSVIKNVNTKCVFWLSVHPSPKTFLFLRRSERDMVKNVWWSPCKVPSILVRLEWNLHALDRFSKNIKFHENPSSRSRFVPCGETDERKNMTKLTVDFRNFAKAPKNVSVPYVTPFHVHSTEKELLFLPLLRCSSCRAKAVDPQQENTAFYIHTHTSALWTFMCRLSWNMGASTSWNSQGLSRSVLGLLCVCVCVHTHIRYGEMFIRLEARSELYSKRDTQCMIGR
jgi:hypothetical protein